MIGIGERAPDFALPRGGAGPARFYGDVGGSPAVLLFAGRASDGGAEAAARVREALGAAGGVHVVACQQAASDEAAFHDPEAMVHRAYGVDPDAGPVAVVLDRNVRVAATQAVGVAPPEQPGQAPGASRDSAGAAGMAATRDSAGAAGMAATRDSAGAAGMAAILERLAQRPPERPAVRHAPVLLVPNALDDDLCAEVIAAWEAADPVETGVETMADGRRVDALDRLRKRRRDHVVTDPDLLRTLTSHVGRRVLPEVKKAFAYDATRFEGFKIGSYTAEDQGFFEAHRDNLSAATAHRRFALSLNLNDDYDGGELSFPEYGADRYRPERGEALVFSGAHLHQVLPVTRGRRFVLLSFLFGADARRR